METGSASDSDQALRVFLSDAVSFLGGLLEDVEAGHRLLSVSVLSFRFLRGLRSWKKRLLENLKYPIFRSLTLKDRLYSVCVHLGSRLLGLNKQPPETREGLTQGSLSSMRFRYFLSVVISCAASVQEDPNI